MTNYNTYTLRNGLRIIHLPSASRVIYCGYQIAAGTRHELPGEEGLAHFCEHMTFKGTERRNALQIINSLERLGGELNAFTNKEDTCFYAAIQREHASQAIGVLTDIVFHSQYPLHEMEKEVEVVCDEIESYNDSPSELIYDEFESIIFEGHPLGHNILGNADQLRRYTTEDLKKFARRNYLPEHAVFFAYGDVDFRKLCKRLDAEFEPVETCEEEPPCSSGEAPMASPTPPQTIVRDMSTHQAHVMTGIRAYSIHHPLRIPLYLLNNVLGGPGMNARLNLSLRERHGLVYTVESSMASYSDTGLWSIYFGCDPQDVDKCLRLIRRELSRLIANPLSEAQLSAAKRQLKGQIAIACDNREQFALDFGRSFLHYGWEKDVAHLLADIDKVTVEDTERVTHELFDPERLTTLIYK